MTRTRWVWLLAIAVVLVASGSVAAVLVGSGDTSSGRLSSIVARPPRSGAPAHPTAAPQARPKDCDTIDDLVRDWVGPPQQGETDAERSERLADKARATADAVSEPTLKQDVNRWADGFAVLAESQHLASDSAATETSADLAAKSTDSINQTADLLHQACPDGWPAQP